LRPPRRSTAGVSQCSVHGLELQSGGYVSIGEQLGQVHSVEVGEEVSVSSNVRIAGRPWPRDPRGRHPSVPRDAVRAGRVKPPSQPGWSARDRRGRRSTSARSCSSRRCRSLSTRADSTGTRSSAASRGRGRRTRSARCWGGSCSRRRFASSFSTRTRTSCAFTRCGTVSTMPCRPAIDRRRPDCRAPRRASTAGAAPRALHRL
jgi:hypothetical protein